MHSRDPLIGLAVLVNFNRRRLEKDSFLTAAAALLALAALPPVLADAAAAALFAKVAPPPVRTTGRHIRPDTACPYARG